jgi:hypothetical protein
LIMRSLPCQPRMKFRKNSVNSFEKDYAPMTPPDFSSCYPTFLVSSNPFFHSFNYILRLLTMILPINFLLIPFPSFFFCILFCRFCLFFFFYFLTVLYWLPVTLPWVMLNITECTGAMKMVACRTVLYYKKKMKKTQCCKNSQNPKTIHWMPSWMVFIHPIDTHLDGFLKNVRFKVLRVPSIGWSLQSQVKLAGVRTPLGWVGSPWGGNNNMIFQLSNITVTGGLKDLPLYLLHKNSDNNLIYCCGVTLWQRKLYM